MLSGLEGFFSGIDGAADQFDSIELPLIGGGPFDDLAASLRSLRTGVLGTKAGASYSDGLGKWLQDQASAGTSTSEAILNEIRTALFDGLSPLNDGYASPDDTLFGFVVPRLDEYGALQYDDNGKLLTKFPEGPEDIELVLSDSGLLTFNLKFGGVLLDELVPIDFDAGLPGLNLDVNANLQARIDYLMGIGLGLGNMAESGPADFGVFLDTSGINTVGEEVALDVDAHLTPGSTASGTLGFLKMDFTDVNCAGQRAARSPRI